MAVDLPIHRERPKTARSGLANPEHFYQDLLREE